MNEMFSDVLVNWLLDHEEAKQDVINYIRTNYPEMENELLFSGLI